MKPSTPSPSVAFSPASMRLRNIRPTLWRSVCSALWLMGGVLAAQDAAPSPAAPAPAAEAPAAAYPDITAAAAPAPSAVSDSGILTGALVLAASFIIGSVLMRQKAA